MNIIEFYEKDKLGRIKQKERPHDYDLFTLKELEKNDVVDKKVLDVGAGFGFVLCKLPQSDKYAIELSENRIAYLKKNKIKVSKVDLNTERFPFSSDYFDYIIFTEVIEHLFDCHHVLQEIFRVLRKNGSLFIQTHNSFNIKMRMKYLLGTIPAEALNILGSTKGEHIRIFNYQTIYKLLKQTGFTVIRNRCWLKAGKYSIYLPKKLAPLFSKNLFFIAIK